MGEPQSALLLRKQLAGNFFSLSKTVFGGDFGVRRTFLDNKSSVLQADDGVRGKRKTKHVLFSVCVMARVYPVSSWVVTKSL